MIRIPQQYNDNLDEYLKDLIDFASNDIVQSLINTHTS